MSDFIVPNNPQPDPLGDLKSQIEIEIAQGKYSEEQLAELREIRQEHDHRVEDIVDSHRGDARDIVEAAREDEQAWVDAHPGLSASHPPEPHELADVFQTADTAGIDLAEVVVDVKTEVTEAQLDTWREIVEWRAEQGGENADVVEAQLAQIDAAYELVEQRHDAFHEAFDEARHNEDVVMDDVRETNLPPAPTTIDAGDYHLPPGEHDVPSEV